MNARPLPASLVDNPRLDRWIHFQPDRTVRIATGKVEMGQGVVTAIGQIAAEELDLPLDRVVVLSGDTTNGPDELYTTSSLSVEVSGGSVRLVCAEVRAKALERAALRLNCSRDDLTVVDGQFLQNGAATGQDYWTVAGEIDLTQAATGTRAGEARFGLPRGGKQRAAPRPAGEAERCGLRPRRPAQGCPARPHAAPAQSRRHPGVARRGRDPPCRRPSSCRGRAADHPRGQLRGLRQPGRERRASRGCCRADARQVGQRAPPRAGAAGSGVAERSAERRPAHRRLAGARDATQPPRADDRLAALHRPRLDVAVVRTGRVPRRSPDGALARPGHASVAQEPRSGARPAGRGDHGAAPAWRGLLRPQRRRRCRPRRGPGRHAHSEPLDPTAMAPRGGVRLRAGRPCHAGDPACRSRRARPSGRLDDGDLEPDSRPAARQRQRLSAGVGGVAQSANGDRAVRSAGGTRRRRHAQRRAALRRAGASHPASSRDASAGAHLGAARTGRAAQCLRHRIADRRSRGARR